MWYGDGAVYILRGKTQNKMNAYFICINCSKVVATEKTEEHCKQCYDKDTQKKRWAWLYYGNTDEEERDIAIEAL